MCMTVGFLTHLEVDMSDWKTLQLQLLALWSGKDARLENEHVACNPLQKPETKWIHVQFCLLVVLYSFNLFRPCLRVYFEFAWDTGRYVSIEGVSYPRGYKNDHRLVGDEKRVRDFREHKFEGAHVSWLTLKCANKSFLTIEWASVFQST